MELNKISNSLTIQWGKGYTTLKTGNPDIVWLPITFLTYTWLLTTTISGIGADGPYGINVKTSDNNAFYCTTFTRYGRELSISFSWHAVGY